MRIVYRDDASRELREAAIFYDEQQLGLGDDFIDEAVRSVITASGDSDRFPIVCDDIHRARVRRFPYCVYYRAVRETLEILAIKHHSRDPEYWKGRK